MCILPALAISQFYESWSTFPTLTPTEWKDKIIQDLKGKPFSDII